VQVHNVISKIQDPSITFGDGKRKERVSKQFITQSMRLYSFALPDPDPAEGAQQALTVSG
jgi:hypothetical protein